MSNLSVDNNVDDINDFDNENDSGVVNNTGPHFSFIESFFLVLFNIVGDIAELFDASGIGIVVGFVVDWIIGPITIFWLWIKGVNGVSKNGVAQLVEFIPFIDMLPIRTTAVILTIISTNNPEKLDKLGAVSDVVKKIK